MLETFFSNIPKFIAWIDSHTCRVRILQGTAEYAVLGSQDLAPAEHVSGFGTIARYSKVTRKPA